MLFFIFVKFGNENLLSQKYYQSAVVSLQSSDGTLLTINTVFFFLISNKENLLAELHAVDRDLTTAGLPTAGLPIARLLLLLLSRKDF